MNIITYIYIQKLQQKNPLCVFVLSFPCQFGVVYEGATLLAVDFMSQQWRRCWQFSFQESPNLPIKG